MRELIKIEKGDKKNKKYIKKIENALLAYNLNKDINTASIKKCFIDGYAVIKNKKYPEGITLVSDVDCQYIKIIV